jgi:hypothetical protein
MAIRNYIGSTLYASAALPATNNAAGFEALTWTKVEKHKTLPTFGFTHALITADLLESGVTEKVKGMGVGQASDVACELVDADAGQAILRTSARDNEGNMSLKIGFGSGADNALVTGDEVIYAQGINHSYRDVEGNGTTSRGFTSTFDQTLVEVNATEPV